MNNDEARILELEHKNQELQDNFERVLKLNEDLREEIKKRDKKINQLEKKVSKLEKELEQYRVKPNQPPGSKPEYEKPNSKKSNSKPGQKKGHKGISRTSPTQIHKNRHYYVKNCEHCGFHNLSPTQKTRTKIITDIEFSVINTQEFYHDGVCCQCGHITKAKSLHGTSKTPFGKVTQTLINYLSSVGGMTKRPIESFFRDFVKLDISDTSIINNEIRTSQESIEEYNNYLELIKQEEYSHKDETVYRINGLTNWIWVYDSGQYVFYRIAKTRSKKVVKEDFGENLKQISVNDCYNAYDDFYKQQICWAHLLREAKEHSKKENVSFEEKKFYRELKLLYNKAKDFTNKDPPLEKRQEERVILENELCKLMLSLKCKSEFLERICKRLNNRLVHCFLFVEIKGLPSTNNQAERALRPFVIHRKASQGSKSFNGAQAKVILKTLFENSKRKGEQLVYTFDHLFETQSETLIETT